MVAYDLRLITGNAPHTWLQEGLANYLQVCVYPKSIERGFYQGAFSRPLGHDEGGAFERLSALLPRRAEPRDYAQLASLVAYLIEQKPQLLPALARGLAEGKTVEQVLHQSGSSLERLEADWMQWGKERFAAGGAPSDRPFELPAEFRDR